MIIVDNVSSMSADAFSRDVKSSRNTCWYYMDKSTHSTSLPFFSSFNPSSPSSLHPLPSFPSPSLLYDQSLVARHSVDGEDTVKLLRRVFSHVAASPSSLDGKEIATHIVCREISDMMEVAVICLYLEVTK